MNSQKPRGIYGTYTTKPKLDYNPEITDNYQDYEPLLVQEPEKTLENSYCPIPRTFQGVHGDVVSVFPQLRYSIYLTDTFININIIITGIKQKHGLMKWF